MFIGNEIPSCNSLFTPEGLKIIRDILGWIRIIGPILLVLLVAFDFASGIFNPESGKKSAGIVGKVSKRLIAVALLFFVPTIVRAALNIDGVKAFISDDP